MGFHPRSLQRHLKRATPEIQEQSSAPKDDPKDFPELIYRRWRGEEMLEEVVLPIPMRVFYPDEFLDLIRSAGFPITGSWGGYAGEPYGQGKELVVEFALSGAPC